MASSTTDSLWFVAGSTAEGQAYAVHCGQKSVQDIDIMMVEGTISSPTALIPTNISGFKQIRFDQVKILGGQSCLTSTLNSNGVLCLNGLKMKEHVLSRCRNETTPVAEVPGTDRTEYQTDSAAASVAATQKYDPLASENHFTHVFSDLLHPQQPSLPPNLLKERFRKISDGVMDAMRRYVLPLVTNEQTQKTVTEWCMNEQRFRDLLNMIGPVYGYHLPQKLKQQLQLILDFYDKHKHLSNSFHCKQITDYFKSCMPKEIDWVPAIQIKGFWPDDVKWFLKRFKKNRPHLYDEIIPTTSMHLIAKWPRKTSNTDEELGFRYSFSALERAIAQKRTENEQILNGIARSIYYRYLKTTRNLIPSYFVKTTVLWMCEIMSDLIKKIVGDSSESVARQIGFEWIKFATKQLQQGICPHYFIENVNLLEPYKQELLNEASNTLYEKVNLDQMIQIEFMEIRKQMIEGMYKNDEQFIRQLKVVDLIQAVNDYHEMKHLWSLPVDYNNNDNAVASCLSILNLMGSVDNNQPNWISFRELILKNDEEDEQQQEPPIWGEDVTLWGPSEFTENLRAVALLLKLINEILINESFTDYRCVEYNPHDIQSLQSISREAMNPANMMPYLISVYGSLFTGSSFGMNQNRMKQVLSSFLRRTLIQDQGVGPRLNLQTENVYCNSNWSIRSSEDIFHTSNGCNFDLDSHDYQPRMRNRQQERPSCFSADLMNLFQQAPSKDMTIGDYLDHRRKLIEERNRQTEFDEDLAHALQLSLDNQRLLPSFDAENNNQQYLSNDVTIVVEEQNEQEAKEQHNEFELLNIQTHESPDNSNQQQARANDTTAVEQNLMKGQNKQVLSNGDDLVARTLQLSFEQQYHDYLLASALQAIENE